MKPKAPPDERRWKGNGAGTNGHHHPPTDGPPPADRGADVEEPIRPNEASDDPHRLARVVLAKFAHAEGGRLAYYQDAFYLWDGTAFRVDPTFVPVAMVNEVKAELDRCNVVAVKLWKEEQARKALAGGRKSLPPQVPKVTRNLIVNVAQALAAMASVDRRDRVPPFWVSPRPGDPDPADLLPARNGLVDLGGDTPALRPHTPRLFSTSSLPYDYRPDAPPPARWLGFLDCQWRDDPDSVTELQKWFGLILAPETKHQKMLVLIGPSRSGRSTIREVMTELVGPDNVAATSPLSLASNFGLEPLVGKTLGIMGDARTPNTEEAAVMMDRLLRITGCDPVDVNRKGRLQLDGVRLPIRLVLISNEMPNLRDNGGAIVNRYLPLLMTMSFAGREDPDLPAALKAEISSILNWAIEGRRRLREDEKFLAPESAAHLLDVAREMASPVAVFVDEVCVLEAGAKIECRLLWAHFDSWARRCNHKPVNPQLFGRNLQAATGHKVATQQVRDGQSRERYFAGIRMA
jgi:putative DNA primase/helicase